MTWKLANGNVFSLSGECNLYQHPSCSLEKCVCPCHGETKIEVTLTVTFELSSEEVSEFALRERAKRCIDEGSYMTTFPLHVSEGTGDVS